MIDSVLAYFNQDAVIEQIVLFGSMSLFFVGLFGLLTQKHIVKTFMSITIMESSLFLFFIGSMFHKELSAPILTSSQDSFNAMLDPVPQAMILTAIVIGMAVLALGLSFAIEYYKLTKINEIDKMSEMKN